MIWLYPDLLLTQVENWTSNVSGCENPGDVIFAVDSSGSIGKDNFKNLLDVVIDITESLEIDKANTQDRGFRYGFYRATDVKETYGTKHFLVGINRSALKIIEWVVGKETGKVGKKIALSVALSNRQLYLYQSS